jgi:hypothetical protein
MEEIKDRIEHLKTSENELEKALANYDLDQQLEAEFNAINQQFQQLEIKYQSLVTARRILAYATTK